MFSPKAPLRWGSGEDPLLRWRLCCWGFYHWDFYHWGFYHWYFCCLLSRYGRIMHGLFFSGVLHLSGYACFYVNYDSVCHDVYS
jgi:hypothetical protein